MPDEPITVDLPNATSISVAELLVYRASDDVHLATVSTGDITVTQHGETCTWSPRG